MTEIDQSLLTLARANVPSEPDVAACWDLLVKGIGLGWVDLSDFKELREYLQERRDWGVQELSFANLGDSVRAKISGRPTNMRDEVVCGCDGESRFEVRAFESES